MPGKLIAIVVGVVFGALLLFLSPVKAVAAVFAVAVAVSVLRFPLWGLLLFALLATFMPYATVNLGIRTTVSEALLALTWGALLWQAFISPASRVAVTGTTERWLMVLMLFSILPLSLIHI